MKLGRIEWKYIIGILFCAAFVSYLTYLSIPPILPLIIKELKITYTQGGFIISIGAIPCIIFSFLGGMLADKFGMKCASLLSFTCLTLGSLIMFSSSFYPLLLLGRFIIGMGAAITPVITFSIISLSFPWKDIGKLVGLRSIAAPLASIISFPLFSYIGVSYNWRICFLLTVLLNSTLLLLLFMAIHSIPSIESYGKSSVHGLFRRILTNGELWKLGMIWCFTCMALNLIWSWGPTIFTEFKGLSLSQASLISTSWMFAHIPAGPLIGWIRDRYGLRKSIFVASLIAGMVIYPFILFVCEWLLLYISVFIGIASSSIPISVYILTPETVDEESVATGYGFILMLYNLGNAIAPLTLGVLFDLTRSLELILSLFSIFWLIALIVASKLHIK